MEPPRIKKASFGFTPDRHTSVSRDNGVCRVGGDTSLGNNYGDPGLPNCENPPLGFTSEIQRNASNTFGISSAAGAVDEMSRVTPNNFRSSIPVLLLGFAPFYHSPIKAIERDLPF